ncbi:hypothetical protein [Bacillus sp. SM2101]|uniref:hypothetical protein n=1 Tax=Bacillus sp. SM2101 TaxID=2805366 RepID=UPI001BDE4A26|nr:hypothetical protein [Bacillus sp. SM2101]
MNITNKDICLEHPENGESHTVDSGCDYSSEFTHIKCDPSKKRIYVIFSHGDFDEPTALYFTYTKECLDKIWEIEFRDNYDGQLSTQKEGLYWVNDIAGLVYTILMVEDSELNTENLFEIVDHEEFLNINDWCSKV